MKGLKIGLVAFVLLLTSVGAFSRILPDSLQEDVQSFISHLSVDSPSSYGNLRVFTVEYRGKKPDQSPVTTDEALRKGWLVVTEAAKESVPTLDVQNQSSSWIFMMSGEVLLGGKQDRMLRDDTLLPPHSGRIRVAVFCVEQGRWALRSSEFKSKAMVSNPEVRQMARESQDQSAVWGKVAKMKEENSVSSGSGTLADVYEDKGVESRTRKYMDGLARVPSVRRNATGVVVTLGDRILGADLFSDRVLFAELWTKLLRSYALEAGTSRDSWGSIDVNDVERFLKRALRAGVSRQNTPGEGRLFSIRSGEVTGGGLVYEGEMVHVDLFPATGLRYEKGDRDRNPERMAPPHIRQQQNMPN
ncbi:MAG: hypothetical protein HYU64_01745 [Armatimonadetes bacterium]|nr:hypothetical protein [Armatimonadota bacterium]